MRVTTRPKWELQKVFFNYLKIGDDLKIQLFFVDAVNLLPVLDVSKLCLRNVSEKGGSILHSYKGL